MKIVITIFFTLLLGCNKTAKLESAPHSECFIFKDEISIVISTGEQKRLNLYLINSQAQTLESVNYLDHVTIAENLLISLATDILKTSSAGKDIIVEISSGNDSYLRKMTKDELAKILAFADPMHRSVEVNDLKLLNKLIEQGHDINQKSHFSNSPFIFNDNYYVFDLSDECQMRKNEHIIETAVKTNKDGSHQQIIEFLFSRENIAMKDLGHLVSYCVALGKIDTLKRLLAKGVGFTEHWRQYLNLAMHICIDSGDLSTAKLLLAAGANLEAPNADRQTPLLSALVKKEYQLAEFLLKQGASPFVWNRDEKSALHLTQSNNDLFKQIHSKGASLDDPKPSDLLKTRTLEVEKFRESLAQILSTTNAIEKLQALLKHHKNDFFTADIYYNLAQLAKDISNKVEYLELAESSPKKADIYGGTQEMARVQLSEHYETLGMYDKAIRAHENRDLSGHCGTGVMMETALININVTLLQIKQNPSLGKAHLWRYIMKSNYRTDTSDTIKVLLRFYSKEELLNDIAYLSDLSKNSPGFQYHISRDTEHYCLKTILSLKEAIEKNGN